MQSQVEILTNQQVSNIITLTKNGLSQESYFLSMKIVHSSFKTPLHNHKEQTKQKGRKLAKGGKGVGYLQAQKIVWISQRRSFSVQSSFLSVLLNVRCNVYPSVLGFRIQRSGTLYTIVRDTSQTFVVERSESHSNVWCCSKNS